MAENIRLFDGELREAQVCLIRAATLMSGVHLRNSPGDFPSISGVGTSVSRYMQGLSAGCTALADAARSGGEAIAQLLSESTECDDSVARSLDGPSIEWVGSRR